MSEERTAYIQRRFKVKRQLALTSIESAYEELAAMFDYSKPEDMLIIARTLGLVERAMNKLQSFDTQIPCEDRVNEHVIGSWFSTNSRGTICVVACKTNLHEDDKLVWRAYMSTVPGDNEEHDIMVTKDWGNKLDENVAREFFPRLAGFKYKIDNLTGESPTE